jgi:hypothetical protein
MEIHEQLAKLDPKVKGLQLFGSPVANVAQNRAHDARDRTDDPSDNSRVAKPSRVRHG